MTTGFKTHATGLQLQERFKGFWATGGVTKREPHKFHPGQHSWYERCIHYDQLLQDNTMAKSCAWGLAGRVLQNGLFLEAADKYERAVEAKERCEELNERIGIRSKLYDTIALWATHGSYFWEKTTDPIFDVRKIPQQEWIAPVKADEEGEISQWALAPHQQVIADWNADEVIHFAWMVTSHSYPYGTSLFTGCENELEILEQLERDIKEHMHKTAFPQAAIGVGDKDNRPLPDDVEEIRNSISNWEPGEIHATGWPLTQVTISGGSPIENLNDILTFCKDNITDAFMVSPISKLYNSTYASSKEMQEMENARLIVPMQTLIAHILETQLYKPYLEWLGFSVRVCPKVKWTSPESNKMENAEFWTKQVQAGIVPAAYAAEQQGFDLERVEELRREQEQRQLEMQKEQAQLAKVNSQQGEKPKEGRSWKVTELKKEEHKH